MSPTFSFTAKNLEGETKRGTMEGENSSEVARALRAEGFVPVKIEPFGSAQGRALKNPLRFDVGRIFKFARGVSLADKMMFSRDLQIMISAGVPITRALEVLSKQTKNTHFTNAILGIGESIKKGKRVGEALAEYPDIFDTLYVSLVRSGDATGNLTEVLGLLADHLKKEHDLRSRVRGAFMYPAVITVAMGGIGALMMINVVPKISAIFLDLKVELPPLTRAIILLSNFLIGYWWLLLLSIPLFLFLARKLAFTKEGRRFFAWLFLNTPIVSGLTKKINSARFARTLASLVRGGVPILEGLAITKDTLSNVYYKDSMDKIRESVQGGRSLFSAIEESPNIYPSLIIQMVRVGEETGRLGDVLNRIAEFYEEEVDAITKNLSTIIEPILMLVIGLIVGIFAVSMIQPMYSLMGKL